MNEIGGEQGEWEEEQAEDEVTDEAVPLAAGNPGQPERTPLDAYRTDGDPASRVAALSTYLGHLNPGKTYWYLHAAPELLELAGGRLERHLAGWR